ncbi:MAG: tRNA dihydrouridine synthase DusB [Candidatus Schekmanbacteria bacterium RIFCSPHIGHO2_02_FULL_38_11]|uniref:tRNA-dihydrouridine synthase n=1 Tax=Candidatus Schekmanbacteria bacterium RIFCSPLOWO2_12_FULL_38_15 TaxID=1817883 RepID=A0A1F7SHF7_9BACT|nr:MAG: tRNA dihydrouridine synthase DusB [Candidatus Schekmanbacteria bacterium GWA2_38_9]OGL50638.1 MAG: tRNA dihydrouridine synthase DusB [Candidatus Schekmanbacteria bacterium RIFCSPLOWO2_02_FULL_38_14]OGL52668.1 MAG: tRNA dihydrouridine synthase DusB [Candidatus Schekmanbacteria bacterium RIFCSPLOWO2_12_FULL_38_15]OGL55655.1 MAG: tRNA dihydrouridine synthase DusB [Candidatus Schekmanbacteria bacterium RIFCSPHIGHO2_02_FULL_38_11]
MKIGSLKLSGNIFLAPMAGIANLPFRLIAKRFGATLVFSELSSSEALIRDGKKTFDILRTAPEEKPIIFQIFGSNPDSVAEAARIVQELKPDGIDINMGCAVRKVIKSGSGVALMKDPEKIKEILKKVRKAVSLPLTIKIRSGWNSKNINALEIALIAEDEGVDAITIHPRTKEQMFSDRSDWSLIRKIKQKIKIPVIGNGDINTCLDARRMFEETGCDAAMVGRGSMGRPWIFREIREYLDSGKIPDEPLKTEIEKTIIDHFNLSIEFLGQRRGTDLIKKHIAWYTKGFQDSCQLRKKIYLMNRKEEILSAIKVFFSYI